MVNPNKLSYGTHNFTLPAQRTNFKTYLFQPTRTIQAKGGPGAGRGRTHNATGKVAARGGRVHRWIRNACLLVVTASIAVDIQTVDLLLDINEQYVLWEAISFPLPPAEIEPKGPVTLEELALSRAQRPLTKPYLQIFHDFLGFVLGVLARM